MTEFSERFQAALADMPGTARVVVGLSGGIDSVVLLHSTLRHRDQNQPTLRVRAVHVNHGLHQDASEWQQFCTGLCNKLEIPLVSRSVEVTDSGSLEAAAREARYRVFADVIEPGEVLLLAQHLDDQLETLLLRLTRGAGPGPLAGMPRSRVLASGTIYRPLLDFTRAEIETYAKAEGLTWREDPSNAEPTADRNYCRLELLPRVAARWPHYREGWQKSQTLLREADSLLAELADEDLQRIASHDGGALQLTPLRRLNPARQRNLLRRWLASLGLEEPGWHPLKQLTEDLIAPESDSGAEFHLSGLTLQVARDALFALRLPNPPSADGQFWNALSYPLLALPDNGQLQARRRVGIGLDPAQASTLEIRYRQGGERLRLPGRPEKTLKKLLQESDLPAWLRPHLPLLYLNDTLAYAPGFGPAEPYATPPNTECLKISWHAPDFTVRPNV